MTRRTRTICIIVGIIAGVAIAFVLRLILAAVTIPGGWA